MSQRYQNELLMRDRREKKNKLSTQQGNGIMPKT